MKSVKNFGKLTAILVGVLGMSSIFTSCSKETTCDCESTDGISVEVSVEGDCETFELEEEDVTCTEK